MDLPSLDSKPDLSVPGWDKIKRFLASNETFPVTYRAPYHENVDPPMNQLRLIAIAILAALLEPEKMRSRNPAPAIRRAEELLDRLPEYLSFAKLSRVQERKLIAKRAAEKKRLVHRWKMDKGEAITLEQFVGTADCEHKSPRELERMLKRVGFPFLAKPKRPSDFPSFWPAGQITPAAYQYARELDDKRRQKRKVESQKKRRVKRV